MLHQEDQTCERGDGLCEASPSAAALANDHPPHAIGLDRSDVRMPSTPDATQICLCRLSRLEPQLARELLSTLGDPNRAGRLIEELLGGERQVDLQTDAIVELVRVYESLEDIRTAATHDLMSCSPVTCALAPCCNPTSWVGS